MTKNLIKENKLDLINSPQFLGRGFIFLMIKISIASETNKEKNCFSISDFFEQELLIENIFQRIKNKA